MEVIEIRSSNIGIIGIPIEDDSMKQCLKNSQISAKTFDMTCIVGCGGESIVIIDSNDKKKVLKIVLMKSNYKLDKIQVGTVQILDEGKAYKDNRPNEMAANELDHKNIIKYDFSDFQYIDNKLYHITSKSIIILTLR